MGLDLCHSKASLEPNNEGNVYYQDQFSQDALEKHGLQKYIQEVPDIQHLHTVCILKTLEDKTYKEACREKDGYSEGKVSYLLASQNTENELSAIEEKYGLERSQAWFSSAGELSPRNFRFKFVLYSRDTTSLGLYYYDVGYQRKCMDDKFYEIYKGDYIYTAREDFENLLNHVLAEEFPEAYENIKKNFVDSYEEGKSMLYVSW